MFKGFRRPRLGCDCNPIEHDAKYFRTRLPVPRQKGLEQATTKAGETASRDVHMHKTLKIVSESGQFFHSSQFSPLPPLLGPFLNIDSTDTLTRRNDRSLAAVFQEQTRATFQPSITAHLPAARFLWNTRRRRIKQRLGTRGFQALIL